MPTLVYSNFIDTELQAAIDELDLVMAVPSAVAASMPIVSEEEDTAFHVVMFDGNQPPEIVRVVDNPGTGSLAIERGREVTTPRAWAAGTRVRLTVTAEFLNLLPGLAIAVDSSTTLGGGSSSNAKVPTQLAVKTYADTALATKAPLHSPTFTGDVVVPTQANGDSSAKAASTAFVKNQAYAPLASPAFSGTPSAPTPPDNDDSTRIATTAMVQNIKDELLAAITGNSSTFTTGDVKRSFKAVADAGWVAWDDGTIGNALSAATTRANADCENLYKLLWNNCSNANCPVTGGRGVSADADWAGQKPLRLPLGRGRVLGIIGSGLGLTARAMGDAVGAESVVLEEEQLPEHSHELIQSRQNADSGDGSRPATTWPGAPSSLTDPAAVLDTETTGEGDPVSIVQPTTFLFAMIKL